MTDPRSRNRAISEVLSYSLIFGLIVASIAIVTVGGLGSLQSAQTNEQLSNAERAFDVLHDNLADIHGEGAPSRATEISLGNSELFFADNITMRVKITGHPEISREIRPVVFRIDRGRQLVYEAGATIRQERDGGVVLNDPPLSMVSDGDGQVHVRIVRTTAADVQSMGSTTVLVQGQAWKRDVLVTELNGATIEYVALDTPRQAAWVNYFENREYCSVSTSSPNTVRCDVVGGYENPEQLYVTVQAVRLQLIN